MKKELRTFGQAVIGIIVLSFGISIIYFFIPGNLNYCDADQVYMVYFGLIFTIITIGFLINSAVFLVKRHWTKYRRIAISVTVILVILIFTMRSLTTKIVYGNPIYTIRNNKEAFTQIRIRLFENKKFISETYDLSCNVENVGTYEIKNNEFTFLFKSEKSKYLGTRYSFINDTLNCIDCEKENSLIMNKSHPKN